MPVIFLAVIIFLGAYSIGCSQVDPAPRDQLVENLAPIRKIEARANKLILVYQKLTLAGWTSKETQDNFKEHYDLYYIYHKAAAVSLAQGDIESYNSYTRLADKELDGIELQMKSLVNVKAD